MTEVPADTPVSKPLAEPIVATVVVAELHVPPVTLLLNVTELPTHSVVTPDIGRSGFTVTVLLTGQPEGVM